MAARDLPEHWLDACPRVEVECRACECTVKRLEMDEHSCVAALLQHTKEQSELIEKLEHELQSLMD